MNESDMPANVGSMEGLDAGGDDSQFEAWLECHELSDAQGSKLPVYHKQDMREAYCAGLKEARDGAASKLIDVWCANHGAQIGWRRAVEIIAVVTRLPDTERDRLLQLDAVG